MKRSLAIEKPVILKISLLLTKLFERFNVVSWSDTWKNFAVLKKKFFTIENNLCY